MPDTDSVPTTSGDVEGQLHILQVVPTYYPAVRYGGPIRSVHALSAALVRRGHRVTVYTTSMDGAVDSDVPLGRPVDLDGVLVHYFPVRALRRLAWSPPLARKLQTSISEVDLVHLHSIFLWPTYAAARIAHRHGVPYVMSPRGMLVRDVIRRKGRYVKSAWINLVERRSFAKAAAVHVTADVEAADVRDMGLEFPEIFTVPNGVGWPDTHGDLDSGPFSSVPRPYALFLSRINRKKGLDRLIRAWPSVSTLSLVIAGNDDENYLPELVRLAEREGVAGRIRFVGPVADEHKWALYENAEMFILPSYSENFGNVVAEAMAMGCPVVVTPEVGLASLVAEVGAGIVTPGEPAVLAAAINALRVDTSGRLRMGQAGRLAAANRLSWDGVAAQMEMAYRRIRAKPRT